MIRKSKRIQTIILIQLYRKKKERKTKIAIIFYKQVTHLYIEKLIDLFKKTNIEDKELISFIEELDFD